MTATAGQLRHTQINDTHQSANCWLAVVSQSMLPPTELSGKAQQPQMGAECLNCCRRARSHNITNRISKAALNPYASIHL